MQFVLTLPQIIYLLLVPLLPIGAWWLKNNWRRIPEIYLLKRYRSQCVVVTLHRLNGGRVDRIVRPNVRGEFSLEGARHVFLPDAESTTWNAKYRLPHIEVWHGEISPRKNALVITREGNVYVTKIPTDKTGYTASEFENLVTARDLNDIASAISREMRQLSLMYYMIFGILIAVLLSMGLDYYLAEQAGDRVVDTLRAFLNIREASP